MPRAPQVPRCSITAVCLGLWKLLTPTTALPSGAQLSLNSALQRATSQTSNALHWPPEQLQTALTCLQDATGILLVMLIPDDGWATNC